MPSFGSCIGEPFTPRQLNVTSEALAVGVAKHPESVPGGSATSLPVTLA